MKKDQGKIIIISGPSGSGQDAIIEGLAKRGVLFERVITTVTRKPRKGERQGKPYYFISAAEFQRKLANNEFVEWAIVYGDYRGCTTEELKRVKESGKIGVWKVDTQGAVALKKKIPEVITVYIKPPSVEAAVERIRARGLDSEDEIQKRRVLIEEYFKPEHDKKFDYIVINNNGRLKEAVNEVIKIIGGGIIIERF